jgi:hypothetical protein
MRHYQGHNFSTYDSTTYYYTADNNLRSATSCLVQHGVPRFASSTLYDGWYEFQKEALPFYGREESPPIGGLRFLSAMTSQWSEEKQAWDQPWRLDKTYDVQGRLFAANVYDHMGELYSGDTTRYFPNGDLMIRFMRDAAMPDTIKKIRFFENLYHSNGDLKTSFEGNYDKLTRKHEFVYPARSNASSSLAPQVLRLQGKQLILVAPSSHIIVSDVTGRVVVTELVTASMWDIPELPSGLYFISVNGGASIKYLSTM